MGRNHCQAGKKLSVQFLNNNVGFYLSGGRNCGGSSIFCYDNEAAVKENLA